MNRYIKFPLIFGLSMLLVSFLFSFESLTDRLIFSFAFGATGGIILQFYNDYKTRKIKSDADEKDFKPRQNQTVPLFCDFEKAFNLCLDSVESLPNGKVVTGDFALGFIKAKTGANWNSFGNSLEFRLKRMTENFTEIEVSTQPSLRTILIDYGESVKISEKIREFLEQKNYDATCKSLDENSTFR